MARLTAPVPAKRFLHSQGLAFEDVYNPQLCFGSSIGPAASPALTGSFGFCVSIQAVVAGEVRNANLGITCHHVLAPDNDYTPLFYPLEQSSQIIESPSSADHVEWTESLRQSSANAHGYEHKNFLGAKGNGLSNKAAHKATVIDNAIEDGKRLEKAQSFSRNLGFTILTSGMTDLCPLHNCRLDWGAISLDPSRFPDGFSNVRHLTPNTTSICYS